MVPDLLGDSVQSEVGNAPADADRGLFDGGPPLKLQELLGLTRPGKPSIIRRIVWAVLIGWLPLAVFAAGESLVRGQNTLKPFLTDFGVHTRFLIAVPLFIFAEAVLLPRLGAIAQYFRAAGLVTDQDRFAAATESTRRLRDSPVVEVLVIAAAYALISVVVMLPQPERLTWQQSAGGEFGAYSAAGWWHLLVSVPLLIVLLLAWLWRLFLWTRFLWLMAGMDLRLVPSHPDHAAGLMFVGSSVRASFFLGSALGALVAGGMANAVAHRGVSPLAYKDFAIGLVVVVVVLCSGPLLIFSRKLLYEWRRGVFAYGALADGLGRQFEKKWFKSSGPVGEDALEAPDFSAATDLYQVVSNVYAMRLLPVDVRDILTLIVATLLPFVPVLLMTVPLDKLLDGVASLLF